MISEISIINRIKSHFPNYIGDDAAHIDLSSDFQYIVTKDLLVENTHFRTKYVSAKSLACKALHSNLSDLAATGAKPEFILLGLSFPKFQKKYVSEFITYFSQYCKSEKVYVIGGDTTASKEHIFVSITAIGKSKINYIKTRDKAQENNAVCLIGSIGKSHLGLYTFEKQIKGLTNFKERFLFPKAKVKEGIWLSNQQSVTSMIDISDGLFVDLKHISDASNVKIEINLDALPLTSSFVKACKFLKLDHINTALAGGEDYGLLFTVQCQDYERIAEKFFQEFEYRMWCIGTIKNGEGIEFMKNGKKIIPLVKPFYHFGEKL